MSDVDIVTNGLSLNLVKRRLAEYMWAYPRARMGLFKGIVQLRDDVRFSMLAAELKISRMWDYPESTYTDDRYAAYERALGVYEQWASVFNQLEAMIDGEPVFDGGKPASAAQGGSRALSRRAS